MLDIQDDLTCCTYWTLLGRGLHYHFLFFCEWQLPFAFRFRFFLQGSSEYDTFAAIDDRATHCLLLITWFSNRSPSSASSFVRKSLATASRIWPVSSSSSWLWHRQVKFLVWGKCSRHVDANFLNFWLMHGCCLSISSFSESISSNNYGSGKLVSFTVVLFSSWFAVVLTTLGSRVK